MTLRSRVGGLVMGLALVGVMGFLPSLAQDPAKTDAESQTRRVPAYFAKAGVSDEQREKIYAIRAKHQPKIAGLRKQLAEAEAAELSECETVLLDAQKKVLEQLRTEGKAKAKGRTKGARSDAAKSDAKSENQ
jgi:hypothetical protein